MGITIKKMFDKIKKSIVGYLSEVKGKSKE